MKENPVLLWGILSSKRLNNATFQNISVITWQSVLLVEETRVARENHRSATSH